MKLLANPFLLRIYVLLVFLNTIAIMGSQYFVHTKHWDLFWFGSFFYRELLLCVSYFFVFWGLSFLPHILQRIFALSALALSLVCFVLDIFLLYNFDTNLNSYLVVVALESNPQESAEFLRNYLKFPLFVLYAVFGALGVFLWRFVKPLYVVPRVFYAFMLLCVGALLVMVIAQLRPSAERWSDMLSNYTKQIYRAIEGTRNFVEEYKKLHSKFDSLASHLEVKKSKNPVANIVLIIGESTQRWRMSLYGYPLQTTPLLDALRAQKPENFFVFTDVISSHAQTHESLSLSLTFANQDAQGIDTTALRPKSKLKPQAWYEYLNIIDALKLGGYHTISLSNQEPVSLFGNAMATILKRANDAEFVNINDKIGTTKFDGSLLDLLDSRLTESTGKPTAQPRFYALHFMGSHAKYYNRYPLDFAFFTSEDLQGQDLYPTDETLEENQHYLNSIRYGDFVIREIIKRFEDSDSLVLYFSDHGEEVYDWRSFIGHSDSKISRFLVEVPFVIYVSDAFKQKHPALYRRIKKAQHQRYMHDDLMHTLLDIAGVKLKGYEQRRSILASHTKFLDSRLRIVGSAEHHKNYDKDLASK